MTRRKSFSTSFRSPKRGIAKNTVAKKYKQRAGLAGIPGTPEIPNVSELTSLASKIPGADKALGAATAMASTALKSTPLGMAASIGMKALQEDPEVVARREMISTLRQNIESFPDSDAEIKDGSHSDNIFLLPENNKGNPDLDSFARLVRVYKQDLKENDGDQESIFGETFRILEISGTQLMYRPLLRALNRRLPPAATGDEYRKLLNTTYVSGCNSIGVIPLMKYLFWVKYPFTLLNIGFKTNIRDAALEADYRPYFKKPLRCMNEHINDDPEYIKGKKCKILDGGGANTRKTRKIFD